MLDHWSVRPSEQRYCIGDICVERGGVGKTKLTKLGVILSRFGAYD